MAKVYSGLTHLYGNVMAAVDYETTGRRPGYHEIIQIAIVPLDNDLRPSKEIRPFYTNLKPLYPERAEKRAGNVHGLDIDDLLLHAPEPDRVKDLLLEWFERLDIPAGKVLVPLAANSPFESSFTKPFLGVDQMDSIFHSHWRDTMITGIYLNDKAAFAGEPIPFPRVGLKAMAKKFGIINPRPHDAFADAVTEAEVYRALVHMDLF